MVSYVDNSTTEKRLKNLNKCFGFLLLIYRCLSLDLDALDSLLRSCTFSFSLCLLLEDLSGLESRRLSLSFLPEFYLEFIHLFTTSLTMM